MRVETRTPDVKAEETVDGPAVSAHTERCSLLCEARNSKLSAAAKTSTPAARPCQSCTNSSDATTPADGRGFGREPTTCGARTILHLTHQTQHVPSGKNLGRVHLDLHRCRKVRRVCSKWVCAVSAHCNAARRAQTMTWNKRQSSWAAPAAQPATGVTVKSPGSDCQEVGVPQRRKRSLVYRTPPRVASHVKDLRIRHREYGGIGRPQTHTEEQEEKRTTKRQSNCRRPEQTRELSSTGGPQRGASTEAPTYAEPDDLPHQRNEDFGVQPQRELPVAFRPPEQTVSGLTRWSCSACTINRMKFGTKEMDNLARSCSGEKAVAFRQPEQETRPLFPRAASSRCCGREK